MRSPVRIWLSAPKKQSPLSGRLLFSYRCRIRTGDLKCEAFYNKAKQPRSGASPVRIWLSRRRSLRTARKGRARSAFVLFSSVLRVSSSQNQTRAFHSEPRRRRRLSAARVLILLGTRASEITPQGGSPSPPAQIQKPRETIKFPSCFFSNSGTGRRGIPIPGGDDGSFPVEHGES